MVTTYLSILFENHASSIIKDEISLENFGLCLFMFVSSNAWYTGGALILCTQAL